MYWEADSFKHMCNGRSKRSSGATSGVSTFHQIYPRPECLQAQMQHMIHRTRL
jgi:hypothetical protein